MSDIAHGDVDLREQLARIDRLIAETQKLMSEEGKLRSEEAKLHRDRAMAPWQVVTTAMAAGAALMGAGVALGRLLWHWPG